MNKSVFIAEKPSVAQEFAKALKVKTTRHDGYLESENTIVTWCVGHLVTMSYPEAYDIKYKRSSLRIADHTKDQQLYCSQKDPGKDPDIRIRFLKSSI